MAAISFALLFPPYSILNSTISCSQQPRLSPAFTATTRPSILVSTKFSSTSFLSGSSIICVRKLWSMLARNSLDSLFCCVAPSADVRVVKVPHENRDQWLMLLLLLSVKGLFYFLLLITWLVAKTHNMSSLVACPLVLKQKNLNLLILCILISKSSHLCIVIQALQHFPAANRTHPLMLLACRYVLK